MKKKSSKTIEVGSLQGSLVLKGDARVALKALPAASVQCVITSPPYWGLRDYKTSGQIGLEKTLDLFIQHITEVFAEVKRVLKNDGVLWLVVGDGYTSGNRKYRAEDKKYFARAMARGKRPDTPVGLKPKDLLGIPWRIAFALQRDGWYLRHDCIWQKSNAMPESVKDRPNRSHEYVFLFSKSSKYYFNSAALQDKHGKKLRSVWVVASKGYKGYHNATFPVDLVKPCLLSSTKSKDYVLDPFFGSGTVGTVCKRNRRNYVGVELNPQYIKLALKRLELESDVIRQK